MKNNYIIGGGISGLIFKFYNPSFTLISPEIGGGFLKNIYSVSWIHDTLYTRKFLRDLELLLDPYKIKIGYYYNGYVHDYCADNYKLKIIKRKMTDITTSDNIDDFKTISTNLSVQSNILNALYTDINIIFEKLQKNINIIQDKVVKITDTHIYLQTGKKLEYNKLISTIAAPIFWKIYKSISRHALEFKYLPITIVETWDKPLIFNDIYQLIYFAEDYSFNRILKKEPMSYSYEFTGKIDNIKTYLPNVHINKVDIQTIGRIFLQKNIPPNNNITFLGRFAQWNYTSKVQQVIKQSIEYYKHNK